MSRTRWLVGLMAPGALGCTLDLVDPVAVQSPTDLAVFVDARERTTEAVRFSAVLRPGVTRDLTERRVTSTLLAVNGVGLVADSSYATGLLELWWGHALPLPRVERTTLELTVPTVEGVASPPSPPVPVDPAVGEPPSLDWIPGEDLFLEAGPTPAGWAGTGWTLEMTGFAEPDVARAVFVLSSPTPLPDTLLVPGISIPDAGYDSLHASVRYEARRSTANADSTYTMLVVLRQQAVWRIRVVPTPPSTPPPA